METASTGNLPAAEFRRQHDGVGAFIDRSGDIRDFGARRYWRLNHRFQHLGCYHHRLAGAARHPRHLFLETGHPLERQFDAEIAARHHQRVGGLDDLGQPVDRLRFFDLGHHGCAPTNELLGFIDVFGALHEGERDPVDAGNQRRFEICAVFRGHRRDRQIGIGQADALAVGHLAADHYPRHGALGRGVFGDQAHLAVVEQQRVARPQRRQDFRMRKVYARVVAGRLVGIERKALPVIELCRTFGEGTKTQLRPLQVDEDADRAAVAAFDIANGLDQIAHLVMRRVAHVDAEHVGTGLEQLPDHRTV